MTATITIEQHIEELRAELCGSSDAKERTQILDELYQHELMLLALEWKAQAKTATVTAG